MSNKQINKSQAQTTQAQAQAQTTQTTTLFNVVNKLFYASDFKNTRMLTIDKSNKRILDAVLIKKDTLKIFSMYQLKSLKSYLTKISKSEHEERKYYYNIKIDVFFNYLKSAYNLEDKYIEELKKSLTSVQA